MGADFSGIPTETSNDPNDLPALTNAYKHIPGVISATLGYKTTFSDVIGNTVDVLAVDADTFAHTAIWNEQDSAQPLLRTSDNPAAVASVRRTLNGQGKCCAQFSSIFDRRAMIVDLQSDPLYLDFIGVLAIGVIITMLLALIGNLVASRLSTRSRLTNFVVLRALGTTSQQVASILTWEQCMTYVTSIILGTIGGILFSKLALPYLVYTGVTSAANSDVSSAQYYLAQSVPPVQIIIPASLSLILASLAAICLVALAMMVFTASRPSMNQTLRLNED